MTIVIDLDGTICEIRKEGQSYADVKPLPGAREKIQKLKGKGHTIIIHTARHMKTCSNDVAEVKKKIGSLTEEWLKRHEIPYDEIFFGKPNADLYIDDLGKKFEGWDSIDSENLDDERINIVIPMAGEGSRFLKAGYETPKPLIPVKGKTMIEWAMESFDFLDKIPKEKVRFIFIIQEKHNADGVLHDSLKNLFGKESVVIIIPSVSRGQAETCLLAKTYIDNHNKLFIYNCDTYSLSPIWSMIESENPDGIISCFEATDPRYSYAKLDEFGYVEETAEKKQISNLATTGLYYFKRGSDFVYSAEKMLEEKKTQSGEFFVAPCYNELIKNGKRIRTVLASTNHVLGTPEELKAFETI